jgi:hypothetical protein
MHNNQYHSKYAIEERRRQVATLLAQARTETEISGMLGVDQGTVSRDIKVLREMSRTFVYDLAKSDLAYFYRTCIDGIDTVKRRAWDIANRQGIEDKTALLALKLCKECDEARFSLFERGPEIMGIRALEERLINIENKRAAQ